MTLVGNNRCLFETRFKAKVSISDPNFVLPSHVAMKQEREVVEEGVGHADNLGSHW